MTSESGFYGEAAAVAEKQLKKLAREELEEALLEIYTKLFCDADGNYLPEESEAADCAGDFVASCDMMFQRLNLKVT